MERRNFIPRFIHGDHYYYTIPPAPFHWPSSRPQFLSPATGGLSNLVLRDHLLNYELTYHQAPEGLTQHVSLYAKAQAKWPKGVQYELKTLPAPEGLTQHLSLYAKAQAKWPKGVQYELKTLPVKSKLIGDGDGMTVHVSTADPREFRTVPTVVQEAIIQRRQARAIRDYARADALYKFIANQGYRVISINNKEILAREYRIRLRGIDAPEMNMEYGHEAKDALSKLIGQKPLTIHVYGKDPYDRLVGDVYVDGVLVQEKLLREGHAWHYESYDKRPAFAQWQKEAHNAGRGLWANPNPIEPWEFKKNERIRKDAERPYHRGQRGSFSLGRAS